MNSSLRSWNPRQIVGLGGAAVWGVVEVLALARWRCVQWLRADLGRWWPPGG